MNLNITRWTLTVLQESRPKILCSCSKEIFLLSYGNAPEQGCLRNLSHKASTWFRTDSSVGWAHHQVPITPSDIRSHHCSWLIIAQVFMPYDELALSTPIMASFKLASTYLPAPHQMAKKWQGTEEDLCLQAPAYVGTRNSLTANLSAVAAECKEGGTLPGHLITSSCHCPKPRYLLSPPAVLFITEPRDVRLHPSDFSFM